MTYKKVRAGISAILLYAQLLLFFFVVDVSIVKDSAISSLKAITLPLALQEIALLMILTAAVFIGYYVFPMAKWRKIYLCSIGAIEIFFWLCSAVTMGIKKVLGVTEILFMILMCVLIAAGCAAAVFLSPKKEKGRWTMLRVAESLCTASMFGSAVIVVMRYRNELITTWIVILMFGLCAVSMLLFWWFSDRINHVASLVLILGHAIAFIVCFSTLCRKPELEELFSMAYTMLRGKEPTHFLTGLALLLVFLLAGTILLHFLKNLQIVGKYVSIILSCILMLIVLSVGSIQRSTSDVMGVKAEDVTKYEEYWLCVMKDDPAQKGSEIAGYKVGYSSNGFDNSMNRALEALQKATGTDIELVEYVYLWEMADALYSDEVQAVFCGSMYAESQGLIEAGQEVDESGHVFSQDTRVIEVIQIEYVEEEQKLPEDDPWEIDPWEDPTPTPTLPPGVSPTPTPTLPPGVSPTPTPTPRSGSPTPKPTKGPTPTVMPKEPRKDNSGKDLTSEPFIVYVSGIDRYGAVTVRSRSDVNLIMAVNPNTKKITIVTTPRDAYVHIPGITTKQRDKLTHAGLYGPDYSMATLENLYGIEIDFYVRLNFTSMIKIINLLGGVDAEALYDFTTHNGLYTFRKGLNHLDGTTALAFARERKGVTGGDVTRGKHQMEVLKGIINKLSTASVISNYQSLINSITGCTQTDITLSQLVSLAKMQLSDEAKWSVSSYATSGDASYQYCYSYKGKKLWVSLLKQESINKASELLKSTLK